LFMYGNDASKELLINLKCRLFCAQYGLLILHEQYYVKFKFRRNIDTIV